MASSCLASLACLEDALLASNVTTLGIGPTNFGKMASQLMVCLPLLIEELKLVISFLVEQCLNSWDQIQAFIEASNSIGACYHFKWLDHILFLPR